MRTVSPELDEYHFGTTKDHGIENVVVHHVLADLRVIVERNVRRKAIVKAGERKSIDKDKDRGLMVVYKTNTEMTSLTATEE